MNRRTILFWVALAAVLLVIGFVTGGQTQTGAPLDPESTEPLGTRALMLFLDEQDIAVDRELPDGDAPVALLLSDQLTGDQRADLRDWVDAGGTLVVTDPSSPLTPLQADFDNTGSVASGVCTIDGLDGLRLDADSFVRYRLDQSNASCFGDDTDAVVHLDRRRDGRIISIGGGLVFTNQDLAEADNAVLAGRLLVDGNPGSVAVVHGPVFAPGTRTLGDLIGSAPQWATWQLLIAFGLYVLWRAPRFGRPVAEPQPVELPGSLLVRATAELQRRSGGHGRASEVLRADAEHRLRAHLRTSPELPAADLVATATATSVSDLDSVVVERSIAGVPSSSASELTDLLSDIDTINRELTGNRELIGRELTGKGSS